MTFQTLGLCAPILTALEEHGYERPSPIQEKAIPPALAGRAPARPAPLPLPFYSA